MEQRGEEDAILRRVNEITEQAGRSLVRLIEKWRSSRETLDGSDLPQLAPLKRIGARKVPANDVGAVQRLTQDQLRAFAATADFLKTNLQPRSCRIKAGADVFECPVTDFLSAVLRVSNELRDVSEKGSDDVVALRRRLANSLQMIGCNLTVDASQIARTSVSSHDSVLILRSVRILDDAEMFALLSDLFAGLDSQLKYQLSVLVSFMGTYSKIVDK